MIAKTVLFALRLAFALVGMLLFSTVQAQESIVFSMEVDRHEIALNEVVVLTVTVSVPDRRKIEQLELPDVGSLKTIGSSRQESQSISFSTGTISTIQTLLTLRPTKEGRVDLKPAHLKYAGKLYKTKPLRIKVTPRRANPQTQRSRRRRSIFDDDWFRSPLQDLMSRPQIRERDIFIRAFVSPSTVVKGQQVTLSVVIYYRIGAQMKSIRWPKFDGFYLIDRDVSRAKTEEKNIEGKRYQLKTIYRRALFPLRSGEFSFSPIEVDIDVASMFSRSQFRTLKTAPFKIVVEPLPKTGVPECFRQANVGRFSLSAQLDNQHADLNQPVTFTIKLAGTGNISSVRAPELPFLDRFKVFDPTVDSRINKYSSVIQGTKTIEYVLLPLASGELIIPALEFCYFDTKLKQYQILRTPEKTLEVVAGQAGLKQVNSGPGKEINIVTGAFKPIRYESSLAGYGRPFYLHPAFVPAVVAPPLAYLLLLMGMFLKGLVQTDSRRSRTRRARQRARRKWKTAGKAAERGDAGTFFVELKEAIMSAVETRIGSPSQGLPLLDLRQQLVDCGTTATLVDQLVGEVENCDFGRFAPSASRNAEMSDAHMRVGQLLKALEKTERNRG
jgi:hypothetical protein